jgi:3-phosphoshikimate 1-carboxyvinyltransferase
METWTISRRGPLNGTVRVPGDKSIAHRAAILGAIADGPVVVHGFSPAADVLATVEAFERMGVETRRERPDRIAFQGRGLAGLAEPVDVIDCGNSGTSMRLLAGLLAGRPFFSVLTGDPYLRRRPMDRVIAPLRRMGAQIDGRKGGTRAPLSVRGTALAGLRYALPVASAQVKSCLLLAGLSATGETIVEQGVATRDHTERMLAYLGADVQVDGLAVRVTGARPLAAKDLHVPGDFSSAAFFLVAATLVPGSALTLPAVGINPGRIGLLAALAEMGARIETVNAREVCGEPVADLVVRSSPLTAIDVPPEWVPGMIDEIPALAVAAAFAEGTTRITGAAELRVKESDRLSAMAANLGALGVHVRETEDGLAIDGRRAVRGGIVESFGDHRVAMAMAVAALLSDEPVTIEDTACVATSFPGFLARLGEVAPEGARG